MNRWLTAAQAADKLGFKTKSAFYAFVKREGVPCTWLGTSLRFSDRKLDEFMEMASRRPRPKSRKQEAAA